MTDKPEWAISAAPVPENGLLGTAGRMPPGSLWMIECRESRLLRLNGALALADITLAYLQTPIPGADHINRYAEVLF